MDYSFSSPFSLATTQNTNQQKETRSFFGPYFGDIMNWFGPLIKGDGDSVIMRIVSTMAEPAFFGDLSTSEVNNKMRFTEVGTFMIRLGHKRPGLYVISVCRMSTNGKEIGHIMVDYSNGYWSCKTLKIGNCDTLSKFVEEVKKAKPEVYVKSPMRPFWSEAMIMT
eukprot:TRINITY_DN8012_c0_g1_i1.p1 TRINITY_DN8012_c0_g1~~TRINITY_DN8012_c0_g1_i1.p1  ORF type:complete len:166 (+),score=28.69 TRINITY_DN8012_c0_g1_i1:215-712(+)